MTAPKFIILRFILVNRKTGEQRPCWLKTVSWENGPGMIPKSMTTTQKREDAARFGLETANIIGEQFCHLPVWLEQPDGTPLVAETASLRANQHAKFVEYQKAIAEFDAELRKSLPVELLTAFASWKN